MTGIGLSGCMGEDRSGEQPFAPTVETVSAVADGPTARMEGLITASPNSTLLDCGFRYGNDTLVLSAVAELQDRFFAKTDTLDGAGDMEYVNALGTKKVAPLIQREP